MGIMMVESLSCVIIADDKNGLIPPNFAGMAKTWKNQQHA